MSAIVERDGTVRQLDRSAAPDEQITESEVEDPARLSRLLMSMLRDIAQLKRRWWTRRITHRDRVVDATGTAVHRFAHGFGGRVDWWVVTWTSAVGAPALVQHASTDDNTLALVSYEAGTVTLHIAEAG